MFDPKTTIVGNEHFVHESNTSTDEEMRAILDVKPSPSQEPSEPESSEEPVAPASTQTTPPPHVATSPSAVSVDDQEADRLGLRARNTDGTFRKIKAKERIEELLGKHRAAEARARAAEERAARIEADIAVPREPAHAATTQTDPSIRPKPKIEDFQEQPDPYAALAEALTDWKFEQHDAQTRVRIEREQAIRTEQHLDAVVTQAFDEGRKQYADFDAVLKTPHPDPETVSLMETPGLAQYLKLVIAQSGEPAEVPYYLGTHPDELAHIVRLAPGPMAHAIGRIVGLVQARREVAVTGSTSSAVTQSQAHPPLRPVRSAPSHTEERPDGADAPFSRAFVEASAKRDWERTHGGPR